MGANISAIAIKMKDRNMNAFSIMTGLIGTEFRELKKDSSETIVR